MRAVSLALVLTFGAAAPAGAAEAVDAFVTDLGLISCTKWLSTPAFKRDGESWLQGYFTLDNPLAKYPPRVASLTNIGELMDEVRKGCAEKSDRTLFDVAHGVRELVLQGALSVVSPSDPAKQK